MDVIEKGQACPYADWFMIHDYFLDHSMKKEEFEYMVNRCYTMYMQQANNVLFNLLDSLTPSGG